MYVIFIANCEHDALGRTRTLLDRYATRLGDRAWGTLITQDALGEVHGALRHQASRQTSVACYRQDAVNGLRLLWIVGNRRDYDPHARFVVATQAHPRPIPPPLRQAALIARLAGYVHDWGKASLRFQEKLVASTKGNQAGASQKDAVRHEWLSAWLVREWLADSDTKPSPMQPDTFVTAWQGLSFERIKTPPMKRMHSALDALLWTVGTHHGGVGGKLGETANTDGITAHEHIVQNVIIPEHLTKNLTLAAPVTAQDAPEDAARWVGLFEDTNAAIQKLPTFTGSSPYWEGVMLMARTALILADHKVSSEHFPGTRENGIFFANTKKREDQNPRGRSHPSKARGRAAKVDLSDRYLDQPLSWHLKTVGDRAVKNIEMFSDQALPVLDPHFVQALAADRAPTGSSFAWQDRAVDHIAALEGGHLILNVASTGAGKTLANLKMACALRPEGVRLAVAFNLRSLTRQTYAAFHKEWARLGFDDQTGDRPFARDWAYLVGETGAADPTTYVQQPGYDEARAQEDADDYPLADDQEIEGGGLPGAAADAPEWLREIARTGSHDTEPADRLLRLIVSPVLVSTMDWIVAAGEPGQQARHAKAMIRVAHSDLILDEVDSYDVKATVAVMRVVHAAAAFGRNVIVSSATLNATLAQGLCVAYAQGRRVHDALFGERPWHVSIVNDHLSPATLTKPRNDETEAFYRATMTDLAQRLTARPITKRYRIIPISRLEEWGPVLAEQSATFHEGRATSPDGLSCRLSIGLIRVANIETCKKTAEALRQDGRFLVTTYHARDAAERRAWKEGYLDRILNRKPESGWIEALLECLPEVRDRTGDVRLIVVATPVEEVGRDHDFDWAIIEPSSMHSLIQTAGRVNRHRQQVLSAEHYNVGILAYNYAALKGGKELVFCRPGLEKNLGEEGSSHPTHDLHELLQTTQGDPHDEILDAGLIFGEGTRKTRFAHYDERATQHQIQRAIPIVERAEGFESHFMVRNYQKDYPLRDEKPRYLIHIDMDEHQFTYGGKRKRTSHSGKCVVVSTPQDGVWLTLPWEKIQGQIEATISEKAAEQITMAWHGLDYPRKNTQENKE